MTTDPRAAVGQRAALTVRARSRGKIARAARRHPALGPAVAALSAAYAAHLRGASPGTAAALSAAVERLTRLAPGAGPRLRARFDPERIAAESPPANRASLDGRFVQALGHALQAAWPDLERAVSTLAGAMRGADAVAWADARAMWVVAWDAHGLGPAPDPVPPSLRAWVSGIPDGSEGASIPRTGREANEGPTEARDRASEVA